jgi:hypothetical protein
MKKFLFVILALLFSFGVANAAGIPTVTDPQNGPEVWTVEVYNDSGSDLTSGSVVVWDLTDTDMSAINSRKMYVTTASGADDVAVAGVVVDPELSSGTVGTIAIWGPVAVVEETAGSMNAATLVAAAATAGKGTDYGGGGADEAILGVCCVDNTNPLYGGGTNIAVVFVDISRFSDD